MNEQLIVKNFGPIKDATVDFKRVTVFIGPTGGGKSTLAKLAAVFRDVSIYTGGQEGVKRLLNEFGISDFISPNSSSITWQAENMRVRMDDNRWLLGTRDSIQDEADAILQQIKSFNENIKSFLNLRNNTAIDAQNRAAELQKLNREMNEQNTKIDLFFLKNIAPNKPFYFPAERLLLSMLGDNWPDLINEKINIPPSLLLFAKHYLKARAKNNTLPLHIFDTIYTHQDNRDFIEISNNTLLPLAKAASGIQSVTPLLVLLEHLSRNTEQAQSFIIEEPELNLFPLAQFELVKILVEKCAQTEGKNELVLTTHSPYVLTALNLLCYAYHIAQQDEATAKKVAKLIPRHCWIDPDQFAAYYVDRPGTKRKQQVRSIINKKTGLIEENELDTASDELGVIFDKLVRLRKPAQTPSRAS